MLLYFLGDGKSFVLIFFDLSNRSLVEDDEEEWLLRLLSLLLLSDLTSLSIIILFDSELVSEIEISSLLSDSEDNWIKSEYVK